MHNIMSKLLIIAGKCRSREYPVLREKLYLCSVVVYVVNLNYHLSNYGCLLLLAVYTRKLCKT